MKKRNRSPILKEQKFKEIIKIGKQELLVEDVFEAEHSSSSLQARKMSFSGFNMQDIAQKVNMTRSNLYRYVESKRELWIAIRNKFYKQFKEERAFEVYYDLKCIDRNEKDYTRSISMPSPMSSFPM